MKNIVLTGFMASGKTEISKAIAANSRFSMVDTDELVIESEGKSINAIFEEKGEAYFREAEREAVKKASQMQYVVIATGGGVVLNPQNMTELRRTGVVFYLSPTFEVIEQRLCAAAATRPLLRGQEIGEVRKRFEQRLPYYEQCDYKIPVIQGRTPNSYALEILQICEKVNK